MYTMKQTEKKEFIIGEYSFFVNKFPAMKSASISADLAKVIGPAVGGLFSLIGTGDQNGDTEEGVQSILSGIDPKKAVSVLGSAFGALDGDEVERILKRLLIDYRNISVSGPATNGKVAPMDLDLFNEIFCGETQDIFVLCWDVINLNFQSFFKNIGLRFGGQIASMENQISSATESST